MRKHAPPALPLVSDGSGDDVAGGIGMIANPLISPEGFVTQASAKTAMGDDAALIELCFDQRRYDPALFAAYGIAPPEGLERMALKRQADFLAGRVATALALQTLDLPAHDIRSGSNRAPVWPTGIAGAITHSHGRAASLVTHAPDKLCGIDLERIATGTARDAIYAKCLSPGEGRIARTARDYSPDIAATLIFSAKESIFKALYPRVGRFFGFTAAELRDGLSDHSLHFQITEALHPDVPAGFSLEIAYQVRADHVMTWLAIAAPPAPQPSHNGENCTRHQAHTQGRAG